MSITSLHKNVNRSTINVHYQRLKSTKMEIIHIENLIKRFPMGKGEFTALRGIDLSFMQGEFAGLNWPQRIREKHFAQYRWVAGCTQRWQGNVLGQSIGTLSAREAAKLRKQSLGFIFQSYNLLQVHTVFENVEFPLLLLKYNTKREKENGDGCPGMGGPHR
jgi:putative ABC transport system ATP-binding protein